MERRHGTLTMALTYVATCRRHTCERLLQPRSGGRCKPSGALFGLLDGLWSVRRRRWQLVGISSS
ncbi:hypothetical protein NFJ02_10g01120 [Pycnococcus provasolii]